MTVRTRIAPSPTGDPHVGTAYVALFNYALARKHGGQFVLRIEDTDRERSRPESEVQIFEALRWLGLDWDEGPDKGGPHQPYRQSERSEIYRKHAEDLVRSGAAYPCFCSAERLAALRDEQKARKAAVMGYDGLCRRMDPAEAQLRRVNGEAYVIRLAMPETDSMTVTDLLRGEVRFERPQMDDQVLLKTDGFPTYHLANVVDDHLMGITHVVRAEEWLSSLPKHFRLYEAFGWERPVFCHLPLLRNADKSKISKRKNPVSLMYYRDEAGVLPEAMLNFLALMSYSMPDGREEFTLAEFVDGFELERVSLGGPVFDLDKLKWLNGRYLRRLSAAELRPRLEALRPVPFDDEQLGRVWELCRERIESLAHFFDYTDFFQDADLTRDAARLTALIPRDHEAPAVAEMLERLTASRLEPLDAWTATAIEHVLKDFAVTAGWTPKDLFASVRVAVTGRSATPPLFETMAVLGQKLSCRRLRAAAEELRTSGHHGSAA
jgi:glutamyl-tRNA synthetase